MGDYGMLRSKLVMSCLAEYLHGIDKTIQIVQDVMDFNKDNLLMINITSTSASHKLTTDKRVGSIDSIHILFQSALGAPEDNIAESNYMSQIEYVMNSLQNKRLISARNYKLVPVSQQSPNENFIINLIKTPTFEDQGVDVWFSSTNDVNPAVYLGKNEQGRKMFSYRVACRTYILGNHSVEVPNNVNIIEEPADENTNETINNDIEQPSSNAD